MIHFIQTFVTIFKIINLKFYFLLLAFLLNLACLTGQNQELIISKFADIPDNTLINSVEIDSSNNLYICHGTGLTVLNQAINTKKNYLEGKNIIDVVANNGSVWAIDASTLYNLQNNKSFAIASNENTFTSVEIYQNKLYVGSKNGLHVLNQQSGKFEVLNNRNSGLLSNNIHVVYADSKNRLWIGTDKGEVRVENEEWKTYHDGKKISHVYENREGLWFISLDDKTKKQEMWLIDHFNREYDAGFGPDLYRGTFNDFCIDSKGKLYFASDAFIRYDPYEEKTKNFTEKAGLLSSKCTSTICDKNDVVWIGTAGEGLYRLIFEDSKVPKEILPPSVICLVEKQQSCMDKSDAAIKVVATGGHGDYQFSWSDVALSGNNPRNVVNGQYTVTVTDKGGLTSSCTVEILKPEALTIEIVSMNLIKTVNGKDGRIEVKGNGGAGDYKYKWGNGSNKAFLDKLAAGEYAVTVTDKNKCTAVSEFMLTREKILPDLAISNIKVGQTLRINELYFKADSTEISQESNAVLEEIFTFLSSNPSVSVEIGGHTNTIPPHEYCDKLSTERARSVATYFYNKGIAQNRLSYKGYGKRQALTNDTSLDGRKRNQRVEIKIISI